MGKRLIHVRVGDTENPPTPEMEKNARKILKKCKAFKKINYIVTPYWVSMNEIKR